MVDLAAKGDRLMSLSWTAPSALWLLALLPLIWVALRFSRTNFNPTQRVLQALVRSLLLAVLALALARPVMSLGSSRMSIVYLVDVSHSVGSGALTGAAARIEALETELRPDHSRIVAFGGGVSVLENAAALRELAKQDPSDRSQPALRRESTDIEQALYQARAELRPGDVPRIVLFSDGRPTSGDLDAATVQFAAAGIPVFVETLAPRELGDTWLDRIALPDRLTAGGLATVNVAVGSQRAGQAIIEIKSGTKVLASRPVDLTEGLSTTPIDVTFADPGAHVVEATVTMAADPLGANNRLATEAVVGDRLRVLYVEGAMQSSRYLEGALTQSGMEVTVRSAAGMPQQAADLAPWDAVILSDLPRTAISDASMRAIGQWVERDGGGLLVAGGESVFGEASDPKGPGGYRNTELERVTPVTFERKDQPEVAMIIVLDKSWSMAGAVMELCKAAAQAAIDVLSDEQSVGVVTFNDGLNWDVTLRNVGKHRDAIRKAVAAIEPSGHTLIFPAVEQAFIALKDAKARAKHVVLLSDGRSYPDDYEGLLKKMVDAKMTVSSIAVGPAADIELLTNIAKWGKGRSYVVADAKEVPQIFVKEAKNAVNPSFDEKPLKPVVKVKGFLEGLDLESAPSLRGRTATVVKDNAMEMVATAEGDPLLAFWPIGLGRSAVFASDVKDRWASDWLKWRGYGPFFTAVVRAIAKQRAAGVGIEVQASVARGEARPVAVAIEARDTHGNYLDRLKPMITIRSETGQQSSQVARQVAPGRYEARAVANASEALTISVEGADSIKATRYVLPDNAAEYRFREPDDARLRAIAEATGGRLGATAGAIREAATAQAARRALWPALVLAGLALWLVDVLLRRVRLFEHAGPELAR
jgi:Ca-activated chloride channel family protein